MAAPPQLSDYLNNPAYSVLRTESGGYIVTKEEQFIKSQERGQAPQYGAGLVERYEFDQSGRLLSGERSRIETTFQNPRYRENQPLPDVRYYREGENLFAQTYEVIPSKSGKRQYSKPGKIDVIGSGGESQLFKNINPLTPSQKFNVGKLGYDPKTGRYVERDTPGAQTSTLVLRKEALARQEYAPSITDFSRGYYLNKLAEKRTAQPISRLETFSPAARKALGISGRGFDEITVQTSGKQVTASGLGEISGPSGFVGRTEFVPGIVRDVQRRSKESSLGLGEKRRDKEESAASEELGFFDMLNERFDMLNERTANVTTKKLFPDISGFVEKRREKIKELWQVNTLGELNVTGAPKGLKSRLFVIKTISKGGGAAQGAVEGYGFGFYTGVREKPVTTAASFALSAFGEPAIAAAEFGLVKLAATSANAAKVVKFLQVSGKVAGYGLLGYYGVSKTIEVAREPDIFSKGFKVGEISSTEIVPFAGGVPLGRRLSYPIQYRTSFEKGLQALPAKRQGQLRAEFKQLKGRLWEVRAGQTGPGEINFQLVESGTPTARDITRNFLIRNRKDFVLGGSLAQKPQVRDISKLRPSGDIDIYSARTDLARLLSRELRAGGVSARTRGSKVYVTSEAGASSKFIEFNPMEKLNLNLATVMNPFLPRGTAFRETPEGIRIVRLRYQAARKLYGGFEVEVDTLGRARMGRYSKDIPDYKNILEAVGYQRPEGRDLFGFQSRRAQFALPDIAIAPAKSLNIPEDFTGTGGRRGQLRLPERGVSYGYRNAAFDDLLAVLPYKTVAPKTRRYAVLSPKGRGYAGVPSFNYRQTPVSPGDVFGPEAPYKQVPGAPKTPGAPYGGKKRTIEPVRFNFSRPYKTREFEPPLPPPPRFELFVFKAKIDLKKELIPEENIKFSPRYFPSIEAEVFRIKGRKPRGILTGLELRPI